MAVIHTGTGGMSLPGSGISGRPSSSATGMVRYNTDSQSIESYDSSISAWTRVIPPGHTFRYRTIYTRGYMMAGYKDSSPWRNVNRTEHATDITTNLGDLLDRSGGYIDAGYSDYYAYCYNMSNSLNTGATSTWTSSISMSTESGRTHNSSWDLTSARYEVSALLNPNLTIAYLSGGGSYLTDKHNYVTETMYAAGTAPTNPGVGSATMSTSFFGEYRGWLIASSAACYFTYSNETWTNGGMSTSSDGHSKMLGTKLGWGYGKSGGNTATTTITKWSDITGVNLGNPCITPSPSGEENFEVGQNWGYSLGNYNGAQNNEAYTIRYYNDTLMALGSASQPKGHDGASSGGCASASSQVLGGY